MIPSPTILMELPSTLSVIEANPVISVTDASSLPARVSVRGSSGLSVT
jgi:hypothetical protein